MRPFHNGLLWCVVTLALGGGDCRSPGTAGSKNQYDFRMFEGEVDPFGGVPIMPLVASSEKVSLEANAMSSGCGGRPASVAQVASTEPSIATFTLSSSSGMNVTIDVVTAAPGTTELQLLDANGAVIDSIAIEVESIATLDLTTTGPVQIATSGTYTTEVTMHDAAGRELGGTAHIDMTFTGPLTANHIDHFISATLEIFPTGAGSGTVVASSGGAMASLPVQIVDESAVSSIVIGTDSWAPRYNDNDQTEVVWTTAMTATGPIYGSACTWQIADPSVQLSSSRTETDLDQPPYANAQFKLTKPGPFDVTCTIGSAQLTVTLQR